MISSKVDLTDQDVDLAPEKQYPRQLEQAVALIQYLIHDLEKRPGDVSLMGDSAGATLVLSLISHLTHPHPDLQAVDMEGNLRSALLLSPWVNIDTSAASMTANKEKDILVAGCLDRWRGAYIGAAEADPWNAPLSAPISWWEGSKVEEFFVLLGDDELLRDDILKLTYSMQVNSGHLNSPKAFR